MALTTNNVGRVAVENDPNEPYPGIVARPLNQPDFLNVRPKNPLIAFRWVNRSAGGGQRLDQMTYSGFILALPVDCISVLPSQVKNGRIEDGDLVLMKIDRKIYEGALKHNWRRAVNRLHPKAQVQNGQNVLRDAVRAVGVPPDIGRKLSTFQPNEREIARDDAVSDKTPLDLGLRQPPKEDAK